jgi:integrase
MVAKISRRYTVEKPRGLRWIRIASVGPSPQVDGLTWIVVDGSSFSERSQVQVLLRPPRLTCSNGHCQRSWKGSRGIMRGIHGRKKTYPRGMGEQGGGSRGRKRPAGSIETLKSGSLRVRVYAGVDKVSGDKRYLTETVPAGPNAWTQAEEIRDRLVRQVEQGRHPTTDATVAQMLERYLDQWEGSDSWLEAQRIYVRRHINPFVGAVKVHRLDVDVLDSFYRELKRCRDHCDGRAFIQHRTTTSHKCDHRCAPHECRGLGARTIRHIHFLLSGAYNEAKRWRWVTDNPMGEAKPPAAPPPNPKPPTAQQAALIINEAWRDPDWGALIWVAMTTGARRGELCALRWNDIDFAPGEETTWIARAIKKSKKKGWVEGPTKTHQQRRVALDPETVLVLGDLRERAKARAVALGVDLAEDAFVFSPAADSGAFYRPATITQRYDRMAGRLKIRTTLHKLRHFSATELIRAGVDIRTVAGRIGHGGGGTTTLKVYTAFVSEADQRAAGKFLMRMPQRPAPIDPDDRVKTDPRYPYERIAARLHEAWRSGELVTGAELTVNSIAAAQEVSVGTAHRVMTLLQRWGVVQVGNGKPSVVLPAPGVSGGATDGCDEQASVGIKPDAGRQDTESGPVPVSALVPVPGEPQRTLAAGAEGSSTAVSPSRTLLTLELVHLGTVVRTMNAHADPTDFGTLERLMHDAVRRAGDDLGSIGEYEMVVHLAGNTDPITTVVVAA